MCTHYIITRWQPLFWWKYCFYVRLPKCFIVISKRFQLVCATTADIDIFQFLESPRVLPTRLNVFCVHRTNQKIHWSRSQSKNFPTCNTTFFIRLATVTDGVKCYFTSPKKRQKWNRYNQSKHTGIYLHLF